MINTGANILNKLLSVLVSDIAPIPAAKTTIANPLPVHCITFDSLYDGEAFDGRRAAAGG